MLNYENAAATFCTLPRAVWGIQDHAMKLGDTSQQLGSHCLQTKAKKVPWTIV